MAQLSEEQYQEWNKRYYEASTALVDRAQKLDEVAELVIAGARDLRVAHSC